MHCFAGYLMTLLIPVTTSEIWMGSRSPAVREYRLYEEGKTWIQAQSFCREREVDMATVGNMEELKLLVEALAQKRGTFWIGLSRVETHQWGWSDGSTSLTSYYRDLGNADGDCVWIEAQKSGHFDHCGNQMPFVCYEYDEHGKEQYIVYKDLKSWQEAQTYCREHHKDLAKVSSPAQWNVSHSTETRFWIGLFRDMWKWSDGNSTSFRNWNPGQPDNHQNSQGCAIINTGLQMRWDDISCNNQNHFFCYTYSKIKRFMIKLSLSSKVDLSLPGQAEFLLQQLHSRLKEKHVSDIIMRLGVHRQNQQTSTL